MSAIKTILISASVAAAVSAVGPAGALEHVIGHSAQRAQAVNGAATTAAATRERDRDRVHQAAQDRDLRHEREHVRAMRHEREQDRAVRHEHKVVASHAITAASHTAHHEGSGDTRDHDSSGYGCGAGDARAHDADHAGAHGDAGAGDHADGAGGCGH